MTFTQRLSAGFYARINKDIRARMAETGIDLLLLDANDDVIYATGFSHYTTERPVVFAISQTGAWLLLPRLEQGHAAHQGIAAQPIVHFEFPGVDAPFDVLARAIPNATGTVGHSPGIAFARVSQFAAAFPNARVPTVCDRRAEAAEEASRGDRAAPRGGARHGRGRCRAHRRRHPVGRHVADRDRDRIPCLAPRDEGHARGAHAGEGTGLRPRLFRRPLILSPRHADRQSDKARRDRILSLDCRGGGRTAESEPTYLIGEPAKVQQGQYAVAQEAKGIGATALIAGNTSASADDLALGYIRDPGLAESAMYCLGHGIGIMFHEPPWIEAGDQTIMQAGMIVSSEPSITIPGLAGYRSADTAPVTADCPDSMREYPRRIDGIVIAGSAMTPERERRGPAGC